MRKTLLFFVFLGSTFLFFSDGVKAEVDARQLIEQYILDNSCDQAKDCMSSYYLKIADLGAIAVEPLLEALDDEDPGYVAHRLDFVYLLSMIGDPRGYSVLRLYFLENKEDENEGYQEGRKWRFAISLGACLAVEKIDDYMSLVFSDTTGGALKALKEISGQDFGQDQGQWTEYLKATGQLEAFREKCREHSKPILG
ncbi:MAG: hypothetical protein HQL21_00890 [Candidatus Omnitrophica bacterium]|nr:hypothetical protein [Candidatus Omnitrophota bacterium]